MRIISLSIATILTLILLASCSATPTPEQMESGDFGPEPDAEAIIRAYLDETLFDPGSLTGFSVTAPEKCGSRCGLGSPVCDGAPMGSPIFGWCADYTANAKNRYGGYTGKQRNSVMIRDGEIIMVNGVFVE